MELYENAIRVGKKLVPIIQKYGGVFADKEMEEQYNEYLSNGMTFGDL